MRPDSITLAIFEKYSPVELAEVATKMAQAVSEMESAESEKKVSDGVFNERIKKHAAEVSEHAQKYNKGGETAQIGCTIRYDIPTVGKKSYIRMDREETVEVHDMTLDEKQETLQFPLSTTASDMPKSKKQPKPKDPSPETPPTEAPAAAAEITFKDIQAIAAHIVTMPVDEVQAAAKQDICPYPGCILFADHDGMHEFPSTGPKGSEPNPEVQPQREAPKPKRHRRPPAEPPQPGAHA